MEGMNEIFGIDKETMKTIVTSALGIISVFAIVSVGYYLYYFFIEKKK